MSGRIVAMTVWDCDGMRWSSICAIAIFYSPLRYGDYSGRSIWSHIPTCHELDILRTTTVRQKQDINGGRNLMKRTVVAMKGRANSIMSSII